MANRVQFPDGTWGSQEELDAYNRLHDPSLTQAERDQAESDMYHASRADLGGIEGGNVGGSTTYVSPGAAMYGGGHGGVDAYRDVQLQDSHNNDALQSQAKLAMDYGLGQMRGNRGPMASENGRLAGREAQSRGQQQDALNMSMKAALGEAPSLAQGQTTQAMNGLMGSRASAMGSANGLSALTGTGLGGSAIGAQSGNIATQGGFGRSQEIGQAMGQYGQLAGDARGQDLSRLGQNSQMSNFNADLNDAWRLGQGQNAINAGKLGNSFDLTDQQRYGASMQPAEIQLQADQTMQGLKAGAETDKSAMSYAKDASKRKSDRDLYMGIGTGIAGAAGTMAGGPLGGAAAAGAVQGIGGSFK